jgi:hypothetical protein
MFWIELQANEPNLRFAVRFSPSSRLSCFSCGYMRYDGGFRPANRHVFLHYSAHTLRSRRLLLDR